MALKKNENATRSTFSRRLERRCQVERRRPAHVRRHQQRCVPTPRARQFDVAGSVPAGSTINSVTLTLSMTRTQVGNVSIGLHAVKEAWGEAGSVASGEGGGGGAAQTNDATWTKRLSPSTAWTTDGGYYASTASATTTVGNAQQAYSWSSAAMTADVQGWLTTPATNYGWILVGNVTSRSTKRFATRTNATAGLRPKLTINFTPPAVAGACCAANGSCSVGAHARHGLHGTYLGGGTSCSPNPCPQPQPLGACCAANATCSSTTEAACSGTWQGDSTSCLMTQCPFVLTPFIDALPIPPVAKPTSPGNYTMAMVQFTHKMHANLPPTTLWGFDDGNGPSVAWPDDRSAHRRADQRAVEERPPRERRAANDARAAERSLPRRTTRHRAPSSTCTAATYRRRSTAIPTSRNRPAKRRPTSIQTISPPARSGTTTTRWASRAST